MKSLPNSWNFYWRKILDFKVGIKDKINISCLYPFKIILGGQEPDGGVQDTAGRAVGGH